MPNKPAFDIGDIVYLRESALLGFMESYKIDSIRFDNATNQWVYTINILNRGPATSSMVDMVDLVSKEKLEFRESELLVFCDALHLAIDEARRRLQKLESIYASRCGESTA